MSYITAAVAAGTWTGDPVLDLLLSLQLGPLKAEVPITCSVPAVLLLAFPDNLLPPGINLDLLRQGRPGVYQSQGSSRHLWTQGHSLHITFVSQASHIRFPALMVLSVTVPASAPRPHAASPRPYGRCDGQSRCTSQHSGTSASGPAGTQPWCECVPWTGSSSGLLSPWVCRSKRKSTLMCKS